MVFLKWIFTSSEINDEDASTVCADCIVITHIQIFKGSDNYGLIMPWLLQGGCHLNTSGNEVM